MTDPNALPGDDQLPENSQNSEKTAKENSDGSRTADTDVVENIGDAIHEKQVILLRDEDLFWPDESVIYDLGYSKLLDDPPEKIERAGMRRSESKLPPEQGSGLSLEAEGSGISLEAEGSGISLEGFDSGTSLESDDSGLSLGEPPARADRKDSRISINDRHDSEFELADLDEDDEETGQTGIVSFENIDNDDDVEEVDDVELVDDLPESDEDVELVDDFPESVEDVELVDDLPESDDDVEEPDEAMPERPDRKAIRWSERVTPVLKAAGVAGLATAGFMTADWLMAWSEIIGSSPVPIIPNSMWLAKYAPLLAPLIPAVLRKLRIPVLLEKLKLKDPNKDPIKARDELTLAYEAIPNAIKTAFQNKKAHSLEENNIEHDVDALVRSSATQLKLTPSSVPDFSQSEKNHDLAFTKYAEYCFSKFTSDMTDFSCNPGELATICSASWELARAIHHTHLKQARARTSYIGGGASLGAGLAIGVAPIVPIAQAAVHLGRWFWNRKPVPDIQFSFDNEGNEVAFPVGVITEVKKNKRKSPPSGKLYTTPLLEKGGTLKHKEGSAVAYYLDHDALLAPETILDDSSIRNIVDVAAVLQKEVLEELPGKSGFSAKPDDAKKSQLQREYEEAKTALQERTRNIKELKTQLEIATRTKTSATKTLTGDGFGVKHPQYPTIFQSQSDSQEVINELGGPTGKIATEEMALKDPDTGEQAAFDSAKNALRKHEHPPAMKIVDKKHDEIKKEIEKLKKELTQKKEALEDAEEDAKKALKKTVKEAQEALDKAEAQISISDDAIKKAFAIRCHQIWEEIQKKKHDTLPGKVTDLAKTIGKGSATALGLGALGVAGSAASGGIAAAMLGVNVTTGAMLAGGVAFVALPLLGVYVLWNKKGEIPKMLGKGVVKAYEFGAGMRSASSHTAADITKPKASGSESSTPPADHH